MSKNFPINHFKHRIKLLKSNEQESSEGQVEIRKTLIGEFWAQINPIDSSSSSKRFLKYSTDTTHEIIMRYQRDISIDDEIIFNSRTFIIKSILNLREENNFLQILTKENIH